MKIMTKSQGERIREVIRQYLFAKGVTHPKLQKYLASDKDITIEIGILNSVMLKIEGILSDFKLPPMDGPHITSLPGQQPIRAAEVDVTNHPAIELLKLYLERYHNLTDREKRLIMDTLELLLFPPKITFRQIKKPAKQ
jgi:hypothetical protein